MSQDYYVVAQRLQHQPLVVGAFPTVEAAQQWAARWYATTPHAVQVDVVVLTPVED